jgi:hypothetical protein
MMSGEGLGVTFEGCIDGVWRDESEAANGEGEFIIPEEVFGSTDAGEEMNGHARKIRGWDYQ